MKNRIAAAAALAASTFASLATATTYTYTLDDMSFVPNQADDQVCRARYYENRGVDRWGTVWDVPLTFTTTYPTSTAYGHFHIGFKVPVTCFVGIYPGQFVNNTCVKLDPSQNRGPFVTHDTVQALYFQLVTNNNAMVPFVVKNIDVYNAATESITVYVRKTDGGWFYWTNLHGYLNGSPNYFRWTLTSAYTGKFQAMAWQWASGTQAFQAQVGRVQITD